MKIEGTSKELEKPFYRLTEIPDPSEVRPEPILKKAMQHILAKHASGSCSVHFVIDQFRSIRLVVDINYRILKFNEIMASLLLMSMNKIVGSPSNMVSSISSTSVSFSSTSFTKKASLVIDTYASLTAGIHDVQADVHDPKL